MSKRIVAIAAAAALWSLSAPAVQTPQYDVPYLGAAASVLSPDKVRASDAVGGGYAIVGGWPLASGQTAIEVRLIDQEMRRQRGKEANFQTSLFVDYVYDFGTSVRGEGGFFSGTKFFALAGLGVIQEDAFGEEGTYGGVAVGAGALIPLGFRGWAIRLDGRAQGEVNGDLCDNNAVTNGFCESEASYLLDYMVAAGLQIPLTMFFKPPPPVEPAEDCPIAVVDPATGRSDCASDSDHDGVSDEADQCPGTQSGMRVDAAGCAEH